jgi:hypothetical protein
LLRDHALEMELSRFTEVCSVGISAKYSSSIRWTKM